MPSEDYSHEPPCSAGRLVKSEKTEAEQLERKCDWHQKKDHENQQKSFNEEQQGINQ